MHSLLSVWRQTGRRAKVALIVAPVLCLVAVSSAAAYSGFFAPNSLNPSEQDATKIVGIQQLVATYVADFDEGPIGEPGNLRSQRHRQPVHRPMATGPSCTGIPVIRRS